MLDIRYIRDNADKVQENAKRKGYTVDIASLLESDRSRRELQQQADELRERRNVIAAQMKGGRPADELITEGKALKEQLATLEAELRTQEEAVYSKIRLVPNMALDDVPVGASEDENVVTKTVGTPREFDFVPKNHAEIAMAKGWLDKERAAKVAGSRFAYLKGDLVMLEWAMHMYALSQLTNPALIERLVKENNLNVSVKPFIPVQPPYVARTSVYEATGRLNKEEQTYKLADDDLWLNASAEHVIAPMYLDEILPEADLPHRYVGYTTAFRREAGTYGKDMEGFLRMHQFNKLEMECFTTPESSYDEHLLQIAIQEHLMTQLDLPYRVVLKCTADIGGPNARGVDIDVWLPGQQQYRETHTADLIGDYQTRRMNTRVRRHDGTVELAHTDDATALSQRPLIALLENHQTKDGDVRVPEVLRAYLGGRDLL
jgi:seryl-tRNA synthetase